MGKGTAVQRDAKKKEVGKETATQKKWAKRLPRKEMLRKNCGKYANRNRRRQRVSGCKRAALDTNPLNSSGPLRSLQPCFGAGRAQSRYAQRRRLKSTGVYFIYENIITASLKAVSPAVVMMSLVVSEGQTILLISGAFLHSTAGKVTISYSKRLL